MSNKFIPQYNDFKTDTIDKIDQIINELKTTNKEIVDENKFLSVESYDCKLNNGKIIRREKILKGCGDGSAAIILPITKDNNVILAVEPRVFTRKTVDIGLPAGYIEEGERPSDAALRELKEETGYVSDYLLYLGEFYQDQGCSAALNHYYVAFNCEKKYDQQLDQGEFVKYVEVSFRELDYLIEHGYIKGLNSAYTLEKAKQFIRE